MIDRDERCDRCGKYHIHRLCDDCYEEHNKFEQRQGALEELKGLVLFVQTYSDGKYGMSIDKDDLFDGFINKRIKELKGGFL